MTNRYLAPSSAGLRMPTDNNPMNGPVVNPPRMAQLGGLDSPRRVSTSANKVDSIGNVFHISKPNGGR